jgi:hypothetical protein
MRMQQAMHVVVAYLAKITTSLHAGQEKPCLSDRMLNGYLVIHIRDKQ